MQWEFICDLRKHIIECFVHWSDNWPTIFRTPPQPLTFETKCSLKKINNNETNIEIYFRGGTNKLCGGSSSSSSSPCPSVCLS